MRLEKFNSFKTHPWLFKAFNKLKGDDIKLATDFIAKNDNLDRGAFELAINRMFVDVANKPKHWSIILELLSNSNTN